MRPLTFILLLCFFVFNSLLVSAQTGDGIPDNCEHAATTEQQSAFPRYEFHNQRLALVSWASGNDLSILDSNLIAEGVYFREWTADCRYLIGTVQINNLSDFVVWDTLTAQRAITVTGERHFTYTYHLYIGNRLIVETPQQAWFINLETGSRITLIADWDEFQNRNFRYSPRLNDTQNWIEVGLLNGERAAYDQSTGQLVADYLQQSSQIYYSDQLDNCYSSSSSHRAGYYVLYRDNQVGYYSSGELVRILNADLATPSFQRHGFTDDCRYFATAIKSATENSFTTIIWDTQTGREMSFADARRLPHPFRFLSNDRALIQTRNGAFLWNLNTNERTLLTEGVQIESRYWETRIFNFYGFDLVDGRLLTTTVSDPTGVTVYDLNTGAWLGFYDNSGNERIRFQFLNENWMVVADYERSAPIHLALWNITTDAGHYLQSIPNNSFYVLSDDGRYFLSAYDGSTRYPSNFYVWDLHNLADDGSANFISDVDFLQTFPQQSIRIQNDILIVGERNYDIFTGEMLYIVDNVAGIPSTPNISAPSSNCDVGNRQAVRYNNQLWIINDETGERIINLGDLPQREGSGGFTRGGCYISMSGRRQSNLQLWDAITYTPIELPTNYTRIMSFTSDGHTALISGTPELGQYGNYLWHIPSNTLTELVADVDVYYYRNPWIYWDYSRGQVLLGSLLSVRAFDLETGQMRAHYEGNSAWDNYREIGGSYVLENQWLILRGGSISVIYNLDTGENTAVRTDQNRIYSFSDGGRYAIGRLGAWWDLDNLPRNMADRTPSFGIRPQN